MRLTIAAIRSNERFMRTGASHSDIYSGYTEIDDEAAKYLVELELSARKHHRLENPIITLKDLVSLSDKSALYLGRLDGALFLNGLKYITDESIYNLTSGSLDCICLNVKELTEFGAACLRKLTKGLFLGIERGDDGVFKQLGLTRSVMFLDELKQITINGLEHLSKHRDYLVLGLNNLTKEQAIALRSKRGSLKLHNITSISDSAAEVLGSRSGSIILRIEEITYDQARIFRGFKGRINGKNPKDWVSGITVKRF